MRGGEESITVGVFYMIKLDSQWNQSDSTIVHLNKHLSATTTHVTLRDVYGIGVDFAYNNKSYNVLAVHWTFDSNTESFLYDITDYYDSIVRNE